MRGLATFSQLVDYSVGTGRFAYKINHAPINITDFPRYPYRGYMLDTSRRFYSQKTIEQILDSLAAAKFNVFHWHIVDDDSFPWELASFPNVTFNGAFAEDQVYTLKIIKEVIAYAELLGIRVIPEFDNPGHTRAIGFDPYFNEIVRCFNRDWNSRV